MFWRAGICLVSAGAAAFVLLLSFAATSHDAGGLVAQPASVTQVSSAHRTDTAARTARARYRLERQTRRAHRRAAHRAGRVHRAGGGPARTSHRTRKHSRVSNPAASASRPLLGVYEKGVPGSYEPVAQFGDAVGRQPRIALFYSGFGEQFRSGFAEQVVAHGGLPLDQINPLGVSIAKIAAGRYDSYLRSLADQVRAFRHRVVIGFGHEMNGPWYPWGWTHVPPSTFIAAWRRVVQVFRGQGADNVTWLWTISRVQDEGPARDYWPGAAYVNWVGIDGYYTGWHDTFGSVFVRAMRAVREFTDDPVLISECAIGQRAGQARMIPNLLSGVVNYHLLGLVWFDVDQHGGLSKQDWRLEGHPSALAAFRRWMRYFA
jgi:mannan endo-1,4-beta-mannosidase